MKSNFKDTIYFVGLNYKKEITKIILINLLLIISIGVLFYFYRFNYIILIGLSALLIIDYFLFDSYSKKRKAIEDSREEEFVTMINYFQIFITNNYNVYQTFQKLTEYASPWMSEQIHNLLSDIDNDKSVKPFSDFSKKFKTALAGNIMLSIYQMVDVGENTDQMMQFTLLFNQLSNSSQTTQIEKVEKRMAGLSTFPLVGAGIITVLLAMGIISIVGDIINVI